MRNLLHIHRRRSISLLAGLAVALPAVLGLFVSGSFATHTQPASSCVQDTPTATQDSTEVQTVFPPGPGLRIRISGHCAPGSDVNVPTDLVVRVNGTVVSALHALLAQTGGNARQFNTELHLPVRANNQVCVELNGQPICVPPSS